MALYTRDSVERTKDAVDMVELVSARTDLRRVGTRYTGLCPFHEERTPSFSVNAEHKLYHCFGCGESGDALRFVQATEGLDFKEALEFLADRYGIELRREREDPRAEERRRHRERLLALLERTVDFYVRYLWESAEAAEARRYLEGRGLGEEVLRQFRIGYAPGAWDRVVTAAQRDGFTLQEVAGAGLGQRGARGGFHDRFRERIMFPLADGRGRVVGFGARAVREGQQPKYLNSSENELYHKGRQLFGLDRARRHAAKAGRVIVSEGYTDVLALHQAGMGESVAIMGTAMTQEQLAELSRVASTVYLALDADRSGQEAMLRAARAARERGVTLRVVAMPVGADPADVVAREGPAGFLGLLDSAVSVPEFEARRLLAGADGLSAGDRDRLLEQARPLIESTPPNTATRDEVVRYVADRLDVPVSYLMAQVTSPLSRTPAPGRPAGAPAGDPGGGPAGAPAGAPAPDAPAAVQAVDRAERAFLAMCLGEPRTGRELVARITDEHLSSTELRRAREHLVSHFDDPLAALPPDDPVLAALVTEIVMLAEEEPSSEPVLRMSYLQLDLRRVEREIRRAGRERDFARQHELYAERERLREDIGAVMGETV